MYHRIFGFSAGLHREQTAEFAGLEKDASSASPSLAWLSDNFSGTPGTSGIRCRS